MRKYLLLFSSILTVLIPTIGNAQLSVGVSSSTQCINASGTATVFVTATPTNAATYSWSVLSPGCAGTFTNLSASGATAGITYPCCGLFTITCSAYTSTNSLISSTTIVTNVICGPSLSIASTATNNTICAGGPAATLTASGATSYTWMPWSTTGSTLLANQGNMCYTLSGTNGSCTSLALYCLSLTPYSNTLAISGNTLICLGQSATLTASGASSYSWFPGGATTSSIVVSPVVSTLYQVYDISGSVLCPGNASQPVIVNANPTINVVSSSTLITCGNTTTFVAMGNGQNYTWSNALTGSVAPVAPLVSTCYSVISTFTSSGCTTMTSVCVTVLPASMSVIGSNSVCLGSGISLTATPAGSFTWNPGGLAGSPVTVSPLSSTTFTVNGVLSNGCSVTNSHVVAVVPINSISVSGNSVVCSGQSTTLTASGAASFSWNPGGITSNPAVLSPSVNTMYTVYQTGGAACPGTVTAVVLVTPVPTIVTSALPGATVLCGNTATLSALSNGLTYAWSTGQNTSLIMVTPTVNTCYSVSVGNSSGCTNTSVICVTVAPAQLSVTGNNTVCLGSSTNLTVTPAGNYTWSPVSLSGSVVNVLPVSSTVYTVNGAFTNGCTGNGTFAVQTDTSCAMVWPGDANSDGVVNSSDVFEIGLCFNATGAARSPTSNAWTAQYATVWTGTVSSGKNKCHADCDGDGAINFNDTIAITANYLSTHAFRGVPSANPDLHIEAPFTKVFPGWNKVNIVLGDSITPAAQLFGLAFDLTFNQQMVENNEAYLTYPSTFLNAGGQNVVLRKLVFSAGVLHAASVRTDGNNVTGKGVLAEFWFKVKEGFPEETPMQFGLSDARKIDNTGVLSGLTTGTTVLAVSNDITTLAETQGSFEPRIYPQPAVGELHILSPERLVRCTITNLIGANVCNESFNGSTIIDVTSFAPGTYIICLESGINRVYRKMIVTD
jgi:hypothetical protein